MSVVRNGSQVSEEGTRPDPVEAARRLAPLISERAGTGEAAGVRLASPS